MLSAVLEGCVLGLLTIVVICMIRSVVRGERRPAAPIGQWLPYASWTLAVAVGCPCLWVLGMQGAAIVIVAAAIAGYAVAQQRTRLR